MRLSGEERNKVAARAAACGVSMPRLLVESALADGPEPVPERRVVHRELLAEYRELAAARRTIAALSGSLARLIRAGGTDAARGELADIAAGVARVAMRLDAAAAGLRSVSGLLQPTPPARPAAPDRREVRR